jgi:hypothetical protein
MQTMQIMHFGKVGDPMLLYDRLLRWANTHRYQPQDEVLLGLLDQAQVGLDHMKVYTCGKKFLPTFPNRSMPVKSMSKANYSPKHGECLSL